MTGPLQDQTVLVVGRGSGLARAVTLAARDAGASVVAAGRDREALPAAYAGEPRISTEHVDLTDEDSMASLAERLEAVLRHQGDLPAHAGEALGTADEQDRVVRHLLGRCRGKDRGRLGTPDDIAQAALFAMTSTFLTGQTLHIDGGEPLT